VAAEPLVKLIREFRPQVILTYDENGGYPHPDQSWTHKISDGRFDAAGDPERYPSAGEPWQPLKLYYHRWPAAKLVAVHEAMLAAGMESPLCRDHEGVREGAEHRPLVTTRVACGEFFETRDDALRPTPPRSTRTAGVPRPAGDPARCLADRGLQLVRSLVDSRVPEDDLFAGVRTRCTRA